MFNTALKNQVGRILLKLAGMARVLYISYDGLTDPLGGSQIIPYLQFLSAKGHHIRVLSLEKKERLEKYGAEVKKKLDESSISWSPSTYRSAFPLLSPKRNMRQLQRAAYRYCREGKPDLVHCRSYMASLIGLRLKKKYGTRFLFDMRGFWADERLEGKIWNAGNPVYRWLYAWFKKKETEFIREADHIVSLTEAAEKDIRKRKETPPRVAISVIPCCADEKLFSPGHIQPGSMEALRTQLGFEKNELVVAYLGSLGTWYMVEEMLDFFAELLRTHPGAKFLFITQDDPSGVKQLAAEKKIPVDQLRFVAASRGEVPALLSLCSFSACFIRPTYSKTASSPTKTGEILFMGKPVVINSGIGDSDAHIRSGNAGIILEQLNRVAYQEAIGKLPALLALPPAHFRATAERYYALQKGGEEYHRIYSTLSK